MPNQEAFQEASSGRLGAHDIKETGPRANAPKATAKQAAHPPSALRHLLATRSQSTALLEAARSLDSQEERNQRSADCLSGSGQRNNGMGNLVSQCVANGAGARRPLVVGPDGGRTTVEENTGVAELMIDAPGHVVARATDVARERRVRAMAADELLRAGVVYLLVPAGRAGARLGDRQAEAIGRLVSGKKSSRKSRPAGGKRVFPADVSGDENNAPEGKDKEVVCCPAKRTHHHGFGPRQWRPALDTIYEA